MCICSTENVNMINLRCAHVQQEPFLECFVIWQSVGDNLIARMEDLAEISLDNTFQQKLRTVQSLTSRQLVFSRCAHAQLKCAHTQLKVCTCSCRSVYAQQELLLERSVIWQSTADNSMVTFTSSLAIHFARFPGGIEDR